MSEDNDDDEIITLATTLHQAAVAAYLALEALIPTEMNPPIHQQRLCWSKFIDEKSRLRNFSRHLRMSKRSFDRLLSFILPFMADERDKANGRGGPIIPELRLYATLRYLAGGSYTDIHFFCGISETSLYRVVSTVIALIIDCKELSIDFPTTEKECENAAEGFRSVSSGDAIINCISVIDGLLVRIVTPSKEEAKNVRSFFSGHYQAYGVNVQAAADHLCRFTFVGVAGPGVMSDSEAITRTPLDALVSQLPGDYCVIGDCAYRPSEHLVPIFGGASAMLTAHDNWNFYASQCRIRIEMAFGMMKQKWGILQSPLKVKLKNVKKIVLAAAYLHNFCINERIGGSSISTSSQAMAEQMNMGQNAFSVYEEGQRISHATAECIDIETDEFRSFSANRIRMVERVKALRLERPERYARQRKGSAI
jgi:hypothetical protein